VKRRHEPGDGIQLGCFFPNGKTGAVFSDELARRNPDFGPDSLISLGKACEDVGLDYVLIADGWVGLDKFSESLQHASPMFNAPLLGAALAAATERIGIITTMHTDVHHPAHVARMGGTLDTLSKGRWGWNIVTDQPNQAALFGREAVEHDRRYQIAGEFTELVNKMWSEDDVFDYHGDHFRSKGRIKAPRPVQDHGPLLVNAAASPAGMAFAAKHCHALMTSAPSTDHAKETRERLNSLLVEAGRAPEDMSLLVTAKCLIRDSQEEAETEWTKIEANINVDVCIDQMQTMYSGDAAMPARLADLDLQEKARRMGSGEWFNTLIGTPEHVANEIIKLHEVGVGGIVLQFLLWSPEEVKRFGAVLPFLEKAGVWIRPEEREWSW
jgi:FMNH2-dependent dimethyl sulfone monooxygenase